MAAANTCNTTHFNGAQIKAQTFKDSRYKNCLIASNQSFKTFFRGTVLETDNPEEKIKMSERNFKAFKNFEGISIFQQRSENQFLFPRA